MFYGNIHFILYGAVIPPTPPPLQFFRITDALEERITDNGIDVRVTD